MRVAVIGCGKQAPKHLHGLRGAGLGNADLVVTDVDAGRAGTLAAKEGVSAIMLDGIWGDAGINAVVIATPTFTHAELAGKAIGSGKAFLCEKPLAGDGREARALAERAEAAGVTGMVGYIYRSVPVFQHVHHLLRDETVLAHLNLALLRIGGRGSHQVWKHQRAHGGGAINEMLVHTLDLALWLFGLPQHVQLLASELRAPTRLINGCKEIVDAEDMVLVRLEYEGGPSVYLQADMLTPAFTQRLEVQGANGTLAASIQRDEPSYLYLVEKHGQHPAGRHALQSENAEPYITQSRTFLTAAAARSRPVYGALHEAVVLHELIDELHLQQEKFT
ncbi:MAG TPA: Gfo/Idh/MocA family oxidoreductase [Gammaproteobacteria bacterium]|nr:Gfo/Idh/MocA family oxidoreductase [Gammaproteobacteria bacterium]